MASEISIWSTVPNDNGTLGSTPIYWPEGQAPSTVNNCARQMMSAIRLQWNDAQWFNWGYTVTKISGTKFQVVTASWNTVTIANVYQVGGRLKLMDTATLYGTIIEVSASASVTNVTFTPDVGSLGASFTAVYNSIITPDLKSIPSGGGIPADVVLQSGAQIYGTDGGSTDAYAISLSPALSSYSAGMAFNWKANTSNTGASTLNINGVGAAPIIRTDGTALQTGDIAAGQIVRVVYDGTSWQMQQTASGGGSGALPATKAQQQAAASNAVYVSPATQQYHPSAIQAWAQFDTSNTINAGYNTSSVTLYATGRNIVNLTTSFTSAAYAVTLGLVWNQCNGFVLDASGTPPTAQAAGFFYTLVVANNNTPQNPNQWMFQATGLQ